MATLRTALTTTTLTLLILTGCTTTKPAPIPVYPSPTCTPEAGGDPYPCTPYDYDQMITKNKLYAQAEAVYRKYLAEEERIYRTGGVTEPTEVMKETLTDDMLRDTTEEFRGFHDRKTTAVGGEFRIAYIKRLVGSVKGGSIVSLEACIDASTATLKSPGSSRKGTVGGERVHFIQVGTALKGAFAEWKEMSSCS
jgi:hypothetical protein